MARIWIQNVAFKRTWVILRKNFSKKQQLFKYITIIEWGLFPSDKSHFWEAFSVPHYIWPCLVFLKANINNLCLQRIRTWAMKIRRCSNSIHRLYLSAECHGLRVSSEGCKDTRTTAEQSSSSSRPRLLPPLTMAVCANFRPKSMRLRPK